MGFQAALVPGTALYSYLESAIRGSLGPGWAERGAAEVRFTAPAHDGDQMTAAAAPSGDGTAVEAVVTRDETGQPQPAATARPGCSAPARSPRTWPASHAAELPASPPPFSEAWALDIGELGSLSLAPTRADIGEFLSGIGEPPDLFGDDVPSAFLSRNYARLMSENVVRSSPSIHTSSRIRRFRRVELGEPLSVRGHIDRLFGRRGNRYYVLDMAYVGEGGDVVMAQRPTGHLPAAPAPRRWPELAAAAYRAVFQVIDAEFAAAW